VVSTSVVIAVTEKENMERTVMMRRVEMVRTCCWIDFFMIIINIIGNGKGIQTASKCIEKINYYSENALK
jgi:hypothetical protein